MPKRNILDFTLTDLQKEFNAMCMPKYTAQQVMEWVYKKGIVDFSQITNISKTNLATVSNNFDIGKMPYSFVTTSNDGTKKYLFKSEYGYIETVMIPEDDRYTVCVSSQVGCRMNCSFCMTGKCGFYGNLSAGEIINQMLSIDEAEKITNVVFMGMGEPLDNIKELYKAIECLVSEWGFGFSPKRITISTSGIIKELKEFLEKTNCHLAISLHNPFAIQRAEIMPIERSNPIKNIIELLKHYDFSHQRRLSFEYILLKDKNDSLIHAKELVKLLKGVSCRINLIRFHSVDGIDLKSPDQKKLEEFRDFLNRNNIIATIRRSRGEDIKAACGQLKNSTN